jgi:dCMP deaminase
MTEKTCGRPSRDEYFMLSAIVIATRASCLKLRSWSVIVKDRRIISSGYNGNPKGITSCLEQGFSNKDKAGVDWTQKGSGHCLATHAEANAIVQNHQQNLEGATMYSLYFPCNECAKLIVSSWIKEFVYLKMYREQVPKAEEMFKQAGITVRQLHIDFTEKLALIQEVITSTRE